MLYNSISSSEMYTRKIKNTILKYIDYVFQKHFKWPGIFKFVKTINNSKIGVGKTFF